ncbi:MAG: cupin domain-containing protein [Armatimonadota bacterium]
MPVHIFHIEEHGVPLPLISRQARLIVWPGSGALTASMNHVVLEAGEANVPHTHASSEDTIFVLEGRGVVRDFTHDMVLPVEAGCVIHVPEGIQHAVAAERRMVSVGGPCPPDLAMLRATGVLAE